MKLQVKLVTNIHLIIFQKVYGWEKNVGKGPVQHAANNADDEDEEDWDNDAPVPGKG